MEGGKKRIMALPIEYEQSHSAPPLLLRRKRRTLRKSPPKRSRTVKPKGVKWANVENKAPLQHVQYYFPKLYKDASKKLLATLNSNQLDALQGQRSIMELPYPEQTLKVFDRQILPSMLETDPTMTKKQIKKARGDFGALYTDERTQEIFRAPALLTILMGWVIKGSLKKSKRSGNYVLTNKQRLELLSEDYDDLEIEIALDLLNQSSESAERRAKAAAAFAISRGHSSVSSNSSNSYSNSDPEYAKIMRRLHGKR